MFSDSILTVGGVGNPGSVPENHRKEHAAWTMSCRVIQNLATGERTVAMVPAPLLPIEQVESAAARVRPVFLFSDGVHYDKVLNALVGAAAASAVLKKEIEGLRAQFRAADPDYPKGRPTEPRSGPSMTNKEVAGAWLYGQLLHEDELRRSYGAGISAEEMLLNAHKDSLQRDAGDRSSPALDRAARSRRLVGPGRRSVYRPR